MKKTRTQREKRSPEDEPWADEPCPDIEPGLYPAICYDTKTRKSFGGRRELYIYFRIQEGEYHGTEVVMYCVYPKGPASSSMKIYKQYALAIGRLPRRNEPISQKAFRNKMYMVEVDYTKRKFADNTLLPRYLQYSVVVTIREVLTGVPESEYEV